MLLELFLMGLTLTSYAMVIASVIKLEVQLFRMVWSH